MLEGLLLHIIPISIHIHWRETHIINIIIDIDANLGWRTLILLRIKVQGSLGLWSCRCSSSRSSIFTINTITHLMIMLPQYLLWISSLMFIQRDGSVNLRCWLSNGCLKQIIIKHRLCHWSFSLMQVHFLSRGMVVLRGVWDLNGILVVRVVNWRFTRLLSWLMQHARVSWTYFTKFT